MTRKYRILSCLLVFAMLLTGLTGCEFGLQQTDGLKIDTLDTGDTYYQHIKASYQKQYPNVTVSDCSSLCSYKAHMQFGDSLDFDEMMYLQNYYDQLTSDLIKGVPKDIIFMDNYYRWFDTGTPPDYQMMMEAGKFADLKPLFAKYAPEVDISRFTPWEKDGKLYAVPVFSQPFVLYSMENLLAKWDFELDTNDNILVFLRKCAAWEQEHGTNPNAPSVFSRQAWEFLYQNIFDILGVEILNYDAHTADFDQPEVLEILQLLKSLRCDISEPVLGKLDSQPLSEVYGNFLFGRMGGWYDGAVLASCGSLIDHSVSVPLWQQDGRMAVSSSLYLMIPQKAVNKRNAIQYLAMYIDSSKYDRASMMQYLFSYFGMDKEYFENGLNVLTVRAYVTADFKDVARKMYENQGKGCLPTYWSRSLVDLLDDYMLGAISIKELKKQAQMRLENYITE